MTETGDQVGTLDYMAPERLTHDEIGPASDVYSLACVLFQCLTGRVPFPATDSVGKLAAQLNDPPPAASLFDRRIPSAMDLVVRTGMDKDPRRRYPSAGELLAAAAAVLVEAPAGATVEVPRTGDSGQSYFVRLLAAVDGDTRDDADDAEALRLCGIAARTRVCGASAPRTVSGSSVASRPCAICSSGCPGREPAPGRWWWPARRVRASPRCCMPGYSPRTPARVLPRRGWR